MQFLGERIFLGGLGHLTPLTLFRSGNASSPRFIPRIGKDIFVVEVNGKEMVKHRGSGGLCPGVSTSSEAFNTDHLWLLPKGSPIPRGIALVNDYHTHWVWSPEVQMPLAKYLEVQIIQEAGSVPPWVKVSKHEIPSLQSNRYYAAGLPSQHIGVSALHSQLRELIRSIENGQIQNEDERSETFQEIADLSSYLTAALKEIELEDVRQSTTQFPFTPTTGRDFVFTQVRNYSSQTIPPIVKRSVTAEYFRMIKKAQTARDEDEASDYYNDAASLDSLFGITKDRK